MAQYLFGAGIIFVTPSADALGTAIATPSPIELGVLQDGSVDFSFDIKSLYGQNSFPVKQARGKGKISGKAKAARVSGALFNSFFFGQPMASGSHSLVMRDITGVVIPASPSTITVAPPNSGTFKANLAVTDAAGVNYTRVATSPTAGQYSLDPATGIYTFASADAGKNVMISYRYDATITGSKKLSLQNDLMGTTPTFSLDLSIPYDGKSMSIVLASCVSGKMAIATKQDDFIIPEFDFEAGANEAGKVVDFYFSE